MKAIDILEWICQESINGEDLNLVDVPNVETQTEEWWYDTMGGCPPHVIQSGTYLYLYASSIPDGMGDVSPDAEIELCNTGSMYDCDYIYLYKID